MRSWLLASLAAYIVLAVVIALALGSFNLPEFRRVAQEGRSVLATVTDTTCASHQTFSYKFRIGDVTYAGRGGAGFGTPPCPKLRPGDEVVVYYLPSRPKTNLPGDIHQRLKNEVISVTLAAVLGPAILVVIGVWSWRRAAPANSGGHR